MLSPFYSNRFNESLIITADPQYGSQNLFDYLPQRKAFGTMESLHDTLVKNWNQVVSKDDLVLCLGDFTQNVKDVEWSRSLIETYTRQLRGDKILIRGNHDAEDTSWYYDCGWNGVIEFAVVLEGEQIEWLNAPSSFAAGVICEIQGIRILFSHFAIFEDEKLDRRYLLEKAWLRELFERYDCAINIHGHSHTRVIDDPRCVCACVEFTEFKPVRIGDFLTQRGLLDATETLTPKIVA